MLTATKGKILPTTITGSMPRPRWFTEQPGTGALSVRLLDERWREQFTDATAVAVSDQQRAGLDIVTNGDYHLSDEMCGYGWMSFALDRLGGLDHDRRIPSAAFPQPAGTFLGAIMDAWPFPVVVGEITGRVPLELDTVWKITQDRADRPVKIGAASAQGLAYALTSSGGGGPYSRDERQLTYDLAGVMNVELRRLADAGCQVIQVEDPLIHLIRAMDPEADVSWHVEMLNRELGGLSDTAEVWVHTCFGSPGGQSFIAEPGYAHWIKEYLYSVHCDVLTVELCDRGFRDQDVELLARHADSGTKIAVGAVSHRRLQADIPEQVAERIRTCLKHGIPAEQLVLSTDCGFGRGGLPRLAAYHKAAALAAGAAIVQRELGLPAGPGDADD